MGWQSNLLATNARETQHYGLALFFHRASELSLSEVVDGRQWSNAEGERGPVSGDRATNLAT